MAKAKGVTPLKDEPFIYWDSCIVLALLKKDKNWISHIRPIFKSAEDGYFKIMISVIARIEVVHTSSGDENKARNIAEHRRKINAFLSRRIFVKHGVDDLLAQQAVELRRDFGLTANDSVHVATAIRHGIKRLVTTDQKLIEQCRGVKGIGLLLPSEFMSSSSDVNDIFSAREDCDVLGQDDEASVSQRDAKLGQGSLTYTKIERAVGPEG
jgi:predicted nucleic acid-binding protein